MRKIYILYYSFFDYYGKDLRIGGIQTYIRNLCDLIKQRNEEPVIVQFANINFTCKYNGITVYGVKTEHISSNKRKVRILYDYAKNLLNNDLDIIIFASDNMNISCDYDNTITIQHGVCWDIPTRGRMNKIIKHLDVILKAIDARKHIINLEKVRNVVCVDYNFLNWYRSQIARVKVDYYVIPNSVNIPKEFAKNKSNGCEIIFARRFETYRGTNLLIDVIKTLNKNNIEYNITLAGEGSQETVLKKELNNYSNVKFIKYKPEDSIDIHKKYDIALIPTIGSEGTSLSLLEAMASKCAVIASNVGGMTNIVLNNYNGYLVNPEPKCFVEKIGYLANNKDEIRRIGECGYETVRTAFNIENWNKSWNYVIEEVLKKKRIV